jgi:hypothetical protein
MTTGVFFFAPMPDGGETAFWSYFADTLSVNRRYLDRTILYVPEHTNVPVKVDVIVHMSSRQRHYPHFMRVQSWLEYVQSPLFDGDTVFLDADMVLNRPLGAEYFGHDYALAFNTVPSVKSWSFVNAGIILARIARKPEAIACMRSIVAIAERLKWEKDPRYPYKCAGVFGLDELCLAAYLGQDIRDEAAQLPADEFRQLADKPVQIFGRDFNTDARSLPSERWPQQRIMHFVANSKEWIADYCSKQRSQVLAQT